MPELALLRCLDPLPSIQQYRVTPDTAADWSPRLREIRTCYWCKSTYPNAGHNRRCEHWHELEPLP